MKALEKASATNLIRSDIVLKEGFCDCRYHRGEYVYQAEGFLCNGKPFVVQKDSKGFHVVINRSMNSAEFPPAVDEDDLARIFQEALR